MIEKRVLVEKSAKKSSSGRNRPKVIKWKGVSMVRDHSFIATVKEIITHAEEIDVTRIGILGEMHSGKSTMAMTIAHTFHTYSKIPFVPKVFYKDDLRNFKTTLQNLKPANYFLIFDDVSFMKHVQAIEQQITEIRHFDEGDYKVVLLFNYHYEKALSPFLREFHFKYVTSIGSGNEKTLAETYGKNNLGLVQQFKMQRKKAISRKAWFERIGPKEPVKYDWRNPFIPALFWNEESIRKIVAPTRYFIDKICSICEEAEGNKEYDGKTLEEVCKMGEASVGKGNFIGALKLLLFTNGLTTHGKNVVRGIRWIDRERKARNMPLEAFANHYGLTETRTRLRKPAYKETA